MKSLETFSSSKNNLAVCSTKLLLLSFVMYVLIELDVTSRRMQRDVLRRMVGMWIILELFHFTSFFFFFFYKL